MLYTTRKSKCLFSEYGQFTLTLSTMHKMMKKAKNIYFNMTAVVAKVVEEEFGPKFQRAGGKIVFGDNDKKLHSDV